MFYFLFKRRVHILFLYWACKLGSWSCCSIYSFDISLSGNSRGNIYRLHKISWIMSPVLENKISEDKTVWIKQEFLYTLYDVPQYWYHSTLNHIFNVVWRGENKGKKQERLNFEPEYQAHNNRNRSMGKLDIRNREFTRELEPIERININVRMEIKTR